MSIRITKHAQSRMDERKISLQAVKHCVTHGVRLVNRTDPNKWTYVDNENNTYVVTDKQTTVAITVFWKK